MKRWFTLAVAALLAAGITAEARAQAKYPERPVRILVPFGAGGLADNSIRLVADKLSGRLGQQFVVENMPGGGGIQAAGELAKQAADGHTLLVVSNGTAISEALFEKLPYNSSRDFAPISTVAWFDMMFVTSSKAPFKSIKDVVAEAQAHPSALNVGTINPGSTQNFSAELFRALTKVNVTLVPFRTTPDVIVALLRGDLGLAVDAYTALKGQIDSGDLRPLAVTGLKRNPALPNTPTMQEAGVAGYEVSGWNAIFTKAGTPPAIIAQLNKELVAITQMPDIKQKYADLGIEARSTTPEELGNRLKADIAKWSDVIAKNNIPKMK